MSNRHRVASHRPFLVVVSSPSGAGKTSVCRAVVRSDQGAVYSVSATTRPRRRNEVHGRDYFFYSEGQFRTLVRNQGLLEHAKVYGHFYGTPKSPVLRAFRAGKDVVADLDIQGMRSAKRALPGTVSVFITAPSKQELSRRLLGRRTESTEALAERQAQLAAELAAVPEFDYLVVNDRLAEAVKRVLAIIRAERLRTSRVPVESTLRGSRDPLRGA